MEKVKFTDLKDVKELKDEYIYLGIVRTDIHEHPDYQFLLYKNDEFLIWCVDNNEYVELSEHDDVLSIAELSKHGGKEF